jgi:hypothetical protein
MSHSRALHCAVHGKKFTRTLHIEFLVDVVHEERNDVPQIHKTDAFVAIHDGRGEYIAVRESL